VALGIDEATMVAEEPCPKLVSTANPRHRSVRITIATAILLIYGFHLTSASFMAEIMS
tara:strand:- start:1557 stop:1730 length:174 start_codon:yes stop_codon:yes gene_type:complete